MTPMIISIYGASGTSTPPTFAQIPDVKLSGKEKLELAVCASATNGASATVEIIKIYIFIFLSDRGGNTPAPFAAKGIRNGDPCVLSAQAR